MSLAEAMDFRDWCESECVRLIGTKGMLISFSDTVLTQKIWEGYNIKIFGWFTLLELKKVIKNNFYLTTSLFPPQRSIKRLHKVN